MRSLHRLATRPTLRFILILYALTMGPGLANAQRSEGRRRIESVPRSSPEPRTAPSVRVDRASGLNQRLIDRTLAGARATSLPARGMSGTEFGRLTSRGVPDVRDDLSLYALETRPHGPNGVTIFHLFACKGNPGPASWPDDPELSAWSSRVAKFYEVHKVHASWATVIAARYGGSILKANNLNKVIFNLISTDLKLSSLVLPADFATAQVVLNCGAFAVDVGAAALTSPPTGGLSIALAIGSVAASGYRCVDSIQELLEEADSQQEELDAYRYASSVGATHSERNDSRERGRGVTAPAEPSSPRDSSPPPSRPSSPPPSRPSSPPPGPLHVTAFGDAAQAHGRA